MPVGALEWHLPKETPRPTNGEQLSPHSRLLLQLHQLLGHEVVLLKQRLEALLELAHLEASGPGSLQVKAPKLKEPTRREFAAIKVCLTHLDRHKTIIKNKTNKRNAQKSGLVAVWSPADSTPSGSDDEGRSQRESRWPIRELRGAATPVWWPTSEGKGEPV